MWLIKIQTRCFLIVTPVIVSCNMFTHCECGGERVRVKESAVIYLPSNENYISILSNGMRRGLCVIARNVVDKASDGNRRKPNLESEIIFDTFTSAMTITFTCSLSFFFPFTLNLTPGTKGATNVTACVTAILLFTVPSCFHFLCLLVFFIIMR